MMAAVYTRSMDTGVASGLPGMGCTSPLDGSRSRRGPRDRRAARGIRRRHHVLRHGRRLLPGRGRCRTQRAVDRPRALEVERRSLRIRVATKGGLIRPQGKWVPDGRAQALAAACARKPARPGRRAHRFV